MLRKASSGEVRESEGLSSVAGFKSPVVGETLGKSGAVNESPDCWWAMRIRTAAAAIAGTFRIFLTCLGVLIADPVVGMESNRCSDSDVGQLCIFPSLVVWLGITRDLERKRSLGTVIGMKCPVLVLCCCCSSWVAGVKALARAWIRGINLELDWGIGCVGWFHVHSKFGLLVWLVCKIENFGNVWAVGLHVGGW